MQSNSCVALPLTVALSAVGLSAQSYAVVPAAYAATDAISYEWISGASRDLRQVTLLGAGHLTALVGQTLTAIELRRTAANETYQGGTTDLTVKLSISPNDPLECSSTFDDNCGLTAVQVFSGLVSLPTSAPQVGPTIGWTANNILRIPFQAPFVYLGGTLCVDIVGQPVAGQNANWWMADAEFEDVSGTAVDLGGGCGSYGGSQQQWASVAERSLLPGAYAHFFAYGPPFSIGLAAFGTRSAAGIPLTLLGLPSGTGCDLHLSTLDVIMVAVFEPDNHPAMLSRGGLAEVRIKIPSHPSVLGFTLTTQWLEWTQMATSNAIEWTVAAAIPTLDMALVEGHPLESTGEVSVHLAHVMRFEYQ